MILGSEHRGVALALTAALALPLTGCPGRRPPAPPRAVAETPRATVTAVRTPTPTPTAVPGPPSVEPPPPVKSLPAGAAAEVVAAARITEAARRDLSAGDTDRALEQLERAVQIGPTAPFAYYYMAEIYLAQGRADEALVLAQRATTLAGGYPSGWAGHAHVLRARALESLGRSEEAERAYRAALAVDPNNVPAREALGDAGR